MRIMDWSSDVCSSDLSGTGATGRPAGGRRQGRMAAAGPAIRPGRSGRGVALDGGAAHLHLAGHVVNQTGGLAIADAVEDRKSVGQGKSVSVSGDLGGSRRNNTQTQKEPTNRRL